MYVSNSLWMEQFEDDLESTSSIEESLDQLVATAHVGVYDEEFHQRIVSEAKELKNKVFSNNEYDEEKKWLIVSLINSYFKVAKLQIDELLDELIYFEQI